MMENTVVKYIRVPIYNPYTEYNILDKYIDNLDNLFDEKYLEEDGEEDGDTTTYEDNFGQVLIALENMRGESHKKKKGKKFVDEEIIKIETDNFFENYL
jgi:hypothetical protein